MQAPDDHARDTAAGSDSERMLRMLLSNLPGMAYRCPNEPSWPLEFVSEGCLELTGHTAAELGRGGSVHYGDLILQEDRQEVWDEVQEALESGEPFLLEYRIRTADGRIRWVWERGAAVRDAEGRIEALEGFIMDVSQRREAQERLRSAERLESVGRLAGGVAHDFNNVLMVVTALSDMIGAARADDAGLQRELGEIRNAASRAASLTRQLLSFSRRQPLEPRLLDLNEVVTGMQSMLPPLLGSSVRLDVQLAPSPGPVRADRAQLEQVLMNLVVNGRDAMPGGGQLTVRTGTRELGDEEAATLGMAPGPAVVLTVQDTGVGMDEQVRSRIFEPFFTTKDPDRGTGLGLATVHGVVCQSSGAVRVSSAPDAGTTFEVLLPRAVPRPGGVPPTRGRPSSPELSRLLDRLRDRLDDGHHDPD